VDLEVDSLVAFDATRPLTLAPLGGGTSGAAGVWDSDHRLASRGAVVGPPARESLPVLIVDDCTLYRENLARVLGQTGATVCVAWDLPSLLYALGKTPSAFVLLNLMTTDSATLLGAATNFGVDARVIAMGVSEQDEQSIVACAEAGVAGYHTRSESLTELLALLDKVAGGETHCSPRVSAILLRRLSALASGREVGITERVLTVREAQILDMLKVGMSNRDIADQLCIAVHTVKNHVHSVLTKLGVRTRAQAVAVSLSGGLPAAGPRI
jgi:DNA-binding NarL/FixJ family response regulator